MIARHLSPITRGMILAAGHGRRMRPLTTTLPKPLVSVNNQALIDHLLNKLTDIGVEDVMVNCHYMADLLEAHLKPRRHPRITLSDEREQLLDTGGGILKVLPFFGAQPFFVINTDSLWTEGAEANLAALMRHFNPQIMDAILLLSPTASSVGYSGQGDFLMTPDGLLFRRPERTIAPFAYTGAALMTGSLFDDCEKRAFSLNLLFDRAIKRQRLYGLHMEGQWVHVGTPEAVLLAQEVIAGREMCPA